MKKETRGRKPKEKGTEYRPRLHDDLDDLSKIGRFIILKCDSEKDSKHMLDYFLTSGIFIRPDSKKGPVRVF